MANVTKEQVVDYLRGLVNAYGPSPSIIDATTYTRSSSTLVTPADAIRVFSANSWDDVMIAYGRYLAASKKQPELKKTPKTTSVKKEPVTKPEPAPEPKPEPEQEHHGHYTREHLLRILKEMYIEFDGHFTVPKLRERARRIPTPSYQTLYDFFGSPKEWAKIVESEMPTKHSFDVTLNANSKTVIELKITSPELPKPITMEITIK